MFDISRGLNDFPAVGIKIKQEFSVSVCSHQVVAYA